MKITSIKTYQLKCNYDQEHVFSDAMGTNSGRQALLIKIETDDDIYGIGEAWSYGSPTQVQAEIIKKQFEPMLLGEDPTSIEKLYQRMYWRTIAHGRRGLILGAISGIDIALWDILGKACHMPIYKLLGGNSNIVPSYASGGFYFHTKKYSLKEAIQGWKQKGYQTYKIKVGRVNDVDGTPCKYSADHSASLGIKEDIDRIVLLRKLVGSDKRIIIDCNSAWTTEVFNLVADKLKEIKLTCLEEPYPFENTEGYEKIHEVFPELEIMGFEGEQNIFNFSKVIKSHYIDVLEPDIGWCGGFTAAKKIAAEAESHFKKISMHSFGSPVHFAASLQMAAAIPNAYPVEDEVNYNPLRTDIIKNKFNTDSSMNYILSSTKPGLGIDIDWANVKKFEIAGEK